MNARETYQAWCARTDLTDAERAELAALDADDVALNKA